MWIPKSEEDIKQAIAAGTLAETLTFDAKALPGKSKDIAKDVAAMAVDGGVILYGVSEDANKRPTLLTPFTLAGAAERIDQIARTSISEPLTYQIHPIPTKSDPAVGYLVVVVPASPRAPHMVTVEKDLRYYGRSATGNTILGEGEVAGLYQQRQRWEVDRDALLAREVQNSPIPPQEGSAYLYLVAKPVRADDDFLERIQTNGDVRDTLTDFIRLAATADVYPRNYNPDFQVLYTWDRMVDGYLTGMAHNPREGNQRHPSRILDLKVDFDGTMHLFCGRAADTSSRGMLILELIIAGLTTRFVRFSGAVCAAAHYYGMVDIGLAVTGLRGSSSEHLTRGLFPEYTPIDIEAYRQHRRFVVADLEAEPQKVASELIMRLIRTTTQDSFDPFQWLANRP